MRCFIDFQLNEDKIRLKTDPPPHLQLVAVEISQPFRRSNVEVVAVAEMAAFPFAGLSRLPVTGRRRVSGAVVVAAVQVDAEQVTGIGLELRPTKDPTLS
jgi:hypothetical protein